LAPASVIATKRNPVSTLRALRVVNDRVAGRNVVIVSSAISSDIRVYERDGQEFQLPSGSFGGRPAAIVDESGKTWTAGESALVSEDGSTTLRCVIQHLLLVCLVRFPPRNRPVQHAAKIDCNSKNSSSRDWFLSGHDGPIGHNDTVLAY
jgi:hypothetical protein